MSGKKFNKRNSRRRLRRELKRTFEVSRAGRRLVRANYGDGLDRGSLGQ